MSDTWGSKIKYTLFGESHGEAIGITIADLPAGIFLDLEQIKLQMMKRAPQNAIWSTSRKEADDFHILSGLYNGKTTGAALTAVIYNTNQKSSDYTKLSDIPRPGHADLPAFFRYEGHADLRGGGHFSGRLTAPLVFAGNIARQILATKKIAIGAYIAQIGKAICPESATLDLKKLQSFSEMVFPVENPDYSELMVSEIQNARKQGNSVGGMIKCQVLGCELGIGNPFFDSVESILAHLLFSIPAVKALSFGAGFNLAGMLGSESNDCFYYTDDGKIQSNTNHLGGIQGGITNGMPITFQLAVKPTPSIALKQQSINLAAKENCTLEIVGRHDPCIVPRMLPVVEAVTAMGILELI